MARARKTDGLSVSWAEKGSYPVRFADDVFGEGSDVLAQTLREVSGTDTPRVLLVADANVVHRTQGLGTRIGRFVQANGVTLAGTPVVIGGGEKIKADGCQTLQGLVASTLAAKVGANDVMLVLGGGTLLDVAGCAAAQVRGGMKLVRMPTTVASMVDGAFADCAAIDADGVKDAVRTPCRPSAVVIDTAFASTVLDGVWRGGIGEAVRYAAVCDATLMKSVAKDAEALKSRDPAAMAKLVRDCVSSRVKGGSTDFALWCAGRLEAMSGYKLPHGYAVPISICVDCAYAVEKGYMKEEQQEFVCRVLADCGALDGLAHSRHLLGQTDSILRGLDSWALSAGSGAVTVPSGVGSCTRDENPDRDAYSKVLKELLSASAEG